MTCWILEYPANFEPPSLYPPATKPWLERLPLAMNLMRISAAAGRHFALLCLTIQCHSLISDNAGLTGPLTHTLDLTKQACIV